MRRQMTAERAERGAASVRQESRVCTDERSEACVRLVRELRAERRAAVCGTVDRRDAAAREPRARTAETRADHDVERAERAVLVG